MLDPARRSVGTTSKLAAAKSLSELDAHCIASGCEETLRVNGTARLRRDPELLASLAVGGREPSLAVVVNVTEAFLHCAKALRRARLRDADARRDRGEMPSLSRMILDQTVGAPEEPAEMARLDAELERKYRDSMY